MENKQLTGKKKSSNGETAEKAKKISVQMRDYLIGHSKTVFTRRNKSDL